MKHEFVAFSVACCLIPATFAFVVKEAILVRWGDDWEPLRAPLTKCPPCSSPEDLVMLPHEETCRKFYLCNHGFPQVMHCPAHLVFNLEEQICDYPENTDCEFRYPATTQPPTTSTEPPTTSTEPPTTSTEPPTTSTEPPTTSTEPPTTSTEQPTTSTEPPTTSTEPSTTSTEPPTTSTEPPTTSTEPPTTSTEPPTTSTEAPTTSTEPPTTSTEPPTTSTEPPTTSTQPPTTKTEPPTTSTEPPTTSTEPPTTSTEPPTTSTKLTPPSIEATTPNTGNSQIGLLTNGCPKFQKIAFIRHPKSCAMFYKCVFGRKYLKSCNFGLEFNLEWRRCTRPQFSFCRSH